MQHRSAINNSLINLGTQDTELPIAAEKVMTALQNTLSDSRGQWILQPHLQAQSEYALTMHSNKGFQRFVMDRTFIDENNIRWIVDYKTGSHQGSDRDAFLDQEQQRYQPQLELYARLFQQLENRPIRLGLYFPMLQGWREWDFKA